MSNNNESYREDHEFNRVCEAIRRNDPGYTSVSIMQYDFMDVAHVDQLCLALKGNTHVQKLEINTKHPFSDTSAQAMSNSIATIPSLRKIYLDGNKNYGDMIWTFNGNILTAIGRNKGIQELTLYTLCFDAETFANLLKVTQSLKRISFNIDRYNSDHGTSNSCRVIANAISSYTDLTYLEINDDVMATELFSAAVAHPSLKTLVIAKMRLSFREQGEWLNAIVTTPRQQKRSRLEMLTFRMCHFTPSTMQPFAEGIQINPTIIHLCFDGCVFENASIRFLGNALKHNRSIVHFSLLNYTIDQGAGLLFQGLHQNKTLRTFQLEKNTNKLGFRLAATVRDIAPTVYSRTLTVLSLKNTYLGTRAGLFLVEGLISSWANTSLVSVDLSACWIGDKACIEIAKALTNNSTLTTLKLGKNFATDDTLYELMRAMSSCTSALQHLFMDRSTFSPIVIKELCSLMTARTIKLETLSLEMCGLRDETLITIFKMFGTNNTYLQSLYLGQHSDYYKDGLDEADNYWIGDEEAIIATMSEAISLIQTITTMSICLVHTPGFEMVRYDIVIKAIEKNYSLQNVRLDPINYVMTESQKVLVEYYMLRNRTVSMLSKNSAAKVPNSLWPHLFVANFRHPRTKGDGLSVMFHAMRCWSGAFTELAIKPRQSTSEQQSSRRPKRFRKGGRHRAV